MGRPNKQHNYYWLKVTLDKYELPVVVADSVEELAQICGVLPRSIIEQISRSKKSGWRCIWKKVPKEEYINLEEVRC